MKQHQHNQWHFSNLTKNPKLRLTVCLNPKIFLNWPHFNTPKMKPCEHKQCYLSNPTKNAFVARQRFTRRGFKLFCLMLRNAGMHLGGRAVACSQISRLWALLVTQMWKSDQRTNAQMDAIKEVQQTMFPCWASCSGPRLKHLRRQITWPFDSTHGVFKRKQFASVQRNYRNKILD